MRGSPSGSEKEAVVEESSMDVCVCVRVKEGLRAEDEIFPGRALGTAQVTYKESKIA